MKVEISDGSAYLRKVGHGEREYEGLILLLYTSDSKSANQGRHVDKEAVSKDRYE